MTTKMKNLYVLFNQNLTDGDLVIVDNAPCLYSNGQLWTTSGQPLTVTDRMAAYVVPRTRTADETTPEHACLARTVKAVAETRKRMAKNDTMTMALKKAITTANKPGHIYAFRNNDLLLYLGYGALTCVNGGQALTNVHGHVYLDLGVININYAYDNIAAGRWNKVNQELASVLAMNFTKVDPTELRMTTHNFSLVDFKALKHAKRGLDIGQVELSDMVSIVTGHEYVSMDTMPNGNMRARAYIGHSDQAPLVFMLTKK